jgi:peptidylprolyl isomerase
MHRAAMIASLVLAVLLPPGALRAQDASAPATAPATGPAAAPAAPALDPLPSPLPGKPVPEGAQVQVTPSGLRYVVLAQGDEATSGKHCQMRDKVRVRYAGYLEDGTFFDGSKEGRDATFGVSQLIRGWSEGLQLMTPGSSFKFIIPWKLAYGEKGRAPKIPARANLVFDVELLEITEPPKPLEPPAFVMPPDSELTTTPSGLKYKVLRAAEGPKPLITDSVLVHYAGWLTSGQGFDNSYERGEPANFAVSGVIKGWSEGLQLMPLGSSYLFVIPSELAYGKAGAGGVIPPDATLVFQVELLQIGGGRR